MNNSIRRLPTGIQSFAKLREEHFVYVDKTEYIYYVAQAAAPFFLSRPRRFGKSLFLSALRAFWEGKKELFEGLAIERLTADDPKAWKKHPVLYIDFNFGNYHQENTLEEVLDAHLREWENEYGISAASGSLGVRFSEVIKQAHKKTGLRCVVLVDEYDKPLLDLIDMPERQKHCKDTIKGFFGTLKSRDEDIQNIFITGVSKFHKVSIFSDLNQLNDISLSEKFSGICGITESEIKAYFAPELADIAKKNNITEEECIIKLKRQYDGYRFHHNGSHVYNPYSLLKAFYDKEFGRYWFETRTPTFLIKQLKQIAFDLRKLTDHTIYANESLLKDYSTENPDPIPLLYQTGYLTIVDYDAESCEYTLSFPNNEVKYGFLQNLMPVYIEDCGSSSGLDIYTFRRYIVRGDIDNIMKVLTALFARITYTRENDPFENYFQAVIYLVFTLLGQFTECEMHTFSGRIDCRVQTKEFIYLFEFKRDESAEKALQQINDKGYTLPFAADSRKLYKIGVSFDSEKRMLSEWKVEE